jgi:hypothetical protein
MCDWTPFAIVNLVWAGIVLFLLYQWQRTSIRNYFRGRRDVFYIMQGYVPQEIREELLKQIEKDGK